MSARHIFCSILTVFLFWGLFSTATAQLYRQQAQLEDDYKELINQIRLEKFDVVLPEAMRKNNIDMWIFVMRERDPDRLAIDFGGTSGVFVFTDRGGERIERAVLGQRWRAVGGSGLDHKLVEECGAYDFVVEATFKRELPGGPESAYDYRFKGIGEFIAERDPKRIAVNYWETLGPPLDVGPRYNDGITFTDYTLLAKELGEKFAKRMVSDEYLRVDYLARVVPSQIKLYTKMRQRVADAHEKDFAKIVPGVTQIGEIEGRCHILVPEKGVLTNGNRPDYVFKRGDLFLISHSSHIGRFYELLNEHGYILQEGETEPPAEIQKIWADHLKIRKVMEETIKVGRTAGDTYELLKKNLGEVGIIANDRQQYYKDLDPEKTQVGVDNHGLEEDPYPCRIGPFGPDWMRDWIIPAIHHFVFEYFMYMPLPHEKHEVKYLNLWFHDGGYVDEGGVKYFVPPPTELRLIQ